MAHGKLYRSFIILQEDEKGHSIANDKPLSGYAKVEVKNDRCKVAFYAQNLKKDYDKCCMMLICNKKDTEALLDLGTMNINPQGKAEISIEFDANNIGNSGVSYDKVIGASLCKKDSGNLKSLMCGFLNGEKPTSNWKSFKKLVCVKPMEPTKVNVAKQVKEAPMSEKTAMTMPKEKKETHGMEKMNPAKAKVAPVTEHVEKDKGSMDKKTGCGCVKSRSKYDEYEKYIDNSDIENGEIVEENISEEENRENNTRLERAEKESNTSVEEEEREVEESKKTKSEKVESEKETNLEEEREEKEEKEARGEGEDNEEIEEKEEKEEIKEREEEVKESRAKKEECANSYRGERKKYPNSEEGIIGKYTYQEDEEDFTLRGTLGEFFEAVVDSLEQTRCTNEIKKCKWYKVPVKTFDSMCNIADYNKYTALYYPMTNYYPYISKHGHFVVGLKCDEYGNVKYLVYGIKGSKERGQQPYDGKTGFVTWTSSPELEKDMGYWLMFYDFKNNIVVVPSK